MAITIPNTFVAGTKIEASPMNANFAEVANAVDKRGDTVTGNIAANAGVKFDGVDLSTIPNSSGTFDPLFAQVVIGTADTNGIRLDLETGTLAVREGDDSAYAPINTGALTVTGAALPASDDGGALGSGTKSWSDLFLASGGVINLANGDVTVTHSSNTLAFAGAATAYTFADGPVRPASNDGAALGVSGTAWSDLFLASGGVINFAAGDVTITHSSDTLTFGGAASGYIFNEVVTLSAANGTSALNFQNDAGNSPWTVYYSSGGTVLSIRDTANGVNTIDLTPGATPTIGLNGTVAIPPAKKLFLDGVAGTGDTYIFESASNQVDIYAGGTQHLVIANTATPYIYARAADLLISAQKKLYLDAGGDTYITESSANVIDAYAGGTQFFQISGPGGYVLAKNANLIINATKKFYLDDGGDTYIYESSANTIKFYCGGVNTLSLDGNDVWMRAGGKFYIDSGSDTYLHEVTSNQFQFVCGGTVSMDITTNAVLSYGSIGVGFYSSGSGTSTGTAVVRNTNGYFYLTSSSRRFKENISTADVTDAQLDAFLALNPCWWDYTGQQNGALGFIAEDLAALPLERYGYSPLCNFDKDGVVESNRDYALIAMQHLLIQRLERKIAALEARLN